MNVTGIAMAIVCVGFVAFLLSVLVALVVEALTAPPKAGYALVAKFNPPGRRREFIVMNFRMHNPSHGRGISRVQVLLITMAVLGFAMRAQAQENQSGSAPSNESPAIDGTSMPTPKEHLSTTNEPLLLLAQASAQQTGEAPPPASTADTWQYGGFIDFGYLHDFNDPANHLFRSRGTAFRVNEPNVNMAVLYLRKTSSESSRWGAEFTAQTGTDSEIFGYSATAPNLDGSEGLRHLGPTDISYLAPVGKGLTVQGGIFNSFIGYDSLYAKDNLNYTRPWGADFTPYLMLGVNAQYPFTTRLTGTAFVISGYWHLAHANNVPSSGGQLAYKVSDHLNVKQTMLYGPQQSDTSIQFWRFLSDSIIEAKPGPATIAFEYQISEEKVAAPGDPRALWMSSQLPLHWAFDKHWSATVRPEVAWDRDGRWTGSSQTVKAVTSTIEYRRVYRAATAIVRLEHRWDDSRGPQGGFFVGDDVNSGMPRLTPGQQLFGVGVILTFDSTFHH